ncbi:hypothetical protein E4U60_003268 [Claviceps pazoutovae]|uniref:Uncharacterized protein n=1 Tax=Claviceps pazoutovae TaxID=1649127 RepID=A0A9P7MAP8_9HYPO|nr:hypothetical protein E4U60_003268 [Claviceps pazoutovae]
MHGHWCKRLVSEPTPISAWTRHHGRCRSRSFTTTFHVGPDTYSGICRGFSFLVNNTILCNRDPMHQRVSKYSEDIDHQIRWLSCTRQSEPTMHTIVTLLDHGLLWPGERHAYCVGPKAFIIDVFEVIFGRHQVFNNAWKLSIYPQWPGQTHGPVPNDSLEYDHLQRNWTRGHNMPD